MKKIIAGLLIITTLAFSAAGCGAKPPKEPNNISAQNQFEVIDDGNSMTYNNLHFLQFVVDKNTGIVWIFLAGANQGGISPYYIIGEDGCPHMVKWEDGKMVELPNS